MIELIIVTSAVFICSGRVMCKKISEDMLTNCSQNEHTMDTFIPYNKLIEQR